MYCTKCGAKQEDGNVFCTKCGAPVEGAVQQPDGPAQEPEASVPEQPAGVMDTVYCTQCGAILEDGNAFCMKCGAPAGSAVQQPEQPVQRWEPSPPEQPAGMPQYPLNGTPVLAAVPVNSYYAAEFENLRAGQKTKFNWAAFFLGPLNQLYHGSTALFKKTFLPYYIVSMVLNAAILIGLTAAAAGLDLAALLWIGAASPVVLSLLFAWFLVLSIINGASYNRRLFEQTNGDAAAVKKIPKNVWLLIAVSFVWYLILAVIVQVGTDASGNTWTSDHDDERDDAPYSYSDSYDSRDDRDEDRDEDREDDEPDSVPEAPSESVPEPASSAPVQAEPGIDLSEFPDLDPAYTELILRASLVYSSDATSGFDNYCLYGDEAVTVGELLYAALGDYEWINTWDGGQTDSYSVFFELDGLEYELRFSAPYGDAFSNATIQGFYSSSGRMLQDGDYNTANLLARLCQYYHTYVRDIAAYSRVFGIYGEWRSEDGSVVLTLEPSSYAGNDYRIDHVDNVGVYVDITRNNGNIDHRILVLSEDYNTLYIYNNNDTSSPAELMGAYSYVG